MTPRRTKLMYAIGFAPVLVIVAAMTGFRYQVYDSFSSEPWRGNSWRLFGIWGGNDLEKLSHWVNVTFVAGNAFLIAWLAAIAAFFRRTDEEMDRLYRLMNRILGVSIFVSWVLAAWVDATKGEGGVIIIIPLIFIPILMTSRVILLIGCELFRWRTPEVCIAAVSFFSLHVGALLLYEPSDSGLPNILAFFFMLGWMLAAVLVGNGWARKNRLNGTLAVAAGRSGLEEPRA